MKDLQKILLELTNFLNKYDEHEWRNVFARLYKESLQYTDSNYDRSFINEINGCFGGMGSFTDLVLHKDMKPLKKENDELEILKDQLYEKCIELRTSKNI